MGGYSSDCDRSTNALSFEISRMSETLRAVRCLAGDARALHAKPEFGGALFQVASQFNLLEMASPNVSLEDGARAALARRAVWAGGLRQPVTAVRLNLVLGACESGVVPTILLRHDNNVRRHVDTSC